MGAPACLATNTYLPSKSQKLLSVTHSSYAATGREVTALHRFDVDISLPVRDGGVVYTAIAPSFDAIYPFWGSVLGSQKYNFLNPQDTNAAYRLDSTQNPTSSSTGAAFNGTNQYLNTHYNPSVNATTDNLGLHLNERTNRVPTAPGITIGGQFGVTSISTIAMAPGSNAMVGGVNGANLAGVAGGFSATIGLNSMQRISSTQDKRYKNGVLQTTTGDPFANRTNRALFVGATGNGGTGD